MRGRRTGAGLKKGRAGADSRVMGRVSDRLAGTATSDARVQRFASDLGDHFARMEPDGVAGSVVTGLGMLAGFVDVDTAFAVLVDDDRISEVWEWRRDGVRTAPPEVGWPVDQAFGSGAAILRQGIALPITDARLLTLDEGTRHRFESTDARALLLVPVRRQDELVGVVGLVGMGVPREWPPETVRQLDVFGDLVLAAVLRLRHQADLAIAAARMRRIADLVPDALLFTAGDGGVTWASRAAQTVLAAAPHELVGLRVETLVHPDDTAPVQQAQWRARVGETLPPLRVRVLVGEAYRWCDVSFSHPPQEGDVPALRRTPPETLVAVRDVHEAHLAAERLATSVGTDSLTGELNRTGLTELLGRLPLADPLALAFCDLDGFKAVNDSHGHGTGDAVLVEVARRLSRAGRVTDAVARLGGDEFVVVLPGVTTDEEAGHLAERLVEAVCGRRGTPLGLAISLSAGVAVRRPGETADSVLQRADAAMYEAKRAGKNRHVVAATVPGRPRG